MTTMRAAAIGAALAQTQPARHTARPGQEDSMRRFRVTVDGTSYDVSVEEVQPPPPAAGAAPRAPAARPERPARRVQAPMPGRILEVRVEPGTAVSPESVLVVLEAMKMENDILAGSGGTVAAVHVQPGDAVNTNDALVELD